MRPISSPVDLSEEERKYFASRDNVHINILNQNIKLMPEKERFSGLRDIAGSLSQSVAHHAYFNQAIANKYDLPTLLLPAYTDLSAYPAADFDAKEKLIIYSPDEAPNKEACLEQISRNLPDFELIEIRDITFDRFMDYATRCMFSISFGEGFDGYLAQPIHQGGIGFTAYNEDFFPSPHFKGYYNIFEDERQMVKCICDRMAKLSSDRRSYVKVTRNNSRRKRKLYVYEDYVEQIRKLSIKQFEAFRKLGARSVRIRSNCLPVMQMLPFRSSLRMVGVCASSLWQVQAAGASRQLDCVRVWLATGYTDMRKSLLF